MIKCPRCGSQDLQKRGKRASGRRIFKCKNCHASFTEGVPYKEATIKEAVNKTCSRCGSTHIVRDGKLKDGAQRYLCRDCNLRFSDNSSESLTTTWECPYCGHLLNYSGYGKLGQREYKCSHCKKSCSGDLLTGKPIKRVYFSETNTSITCPSCESKNIKKAGIAAGNRQKYLCNDCGKSFMTEYKVKPKKEGLREEVIYLVMHGKNVAKMGKKYGFSERYMREFLEPYYAKETITKEQKALIIKFGYHCKVPIDYLAEYVPCSEKMCRRVLKEYREKLSPPTSVPS